MQYTHVLNTYLSISEETYVEKRNKGKKWWVRGPLKSSVFFLLTSLLLLF